MRSIKGFHCWQCESSLFYAGSAKEGCSLAATLRCPTGMHRRRKRAISLTREGQRCDLPRSATVAPMFAASIPDCRLRSLMKECFLSLRCKSCLSVALPSNHTGYPPPKSSPRPLDYAPFCTVAKVPPKMRAQVIDSTHLLSAVLYVSHVITCATCQELDLA